VVDTLAPNPFRWSRRLAALARRDLPAICFDPSGIAFAFVARSLAGRDLPAISFDPSGIASSALFEQH
jgi:hypothetical protein